MPNRDDPREQVTIPEAELQANVDAFQAALVRHGRATAETSVVVTRGTALLRVMHEGHAWYFAIAPGEPPDPARVDELAVLVRERTKAQPGDSLATWEPTVLPALRRAMAEHPVLRGAGVKLETTDAASPTYEVKICGKGWDRTANIRRGLVAQVEGDCFIFADAAAAEARKAHVAAPTPSGVDYAARALAAEVLAPRSEPAIVHESPPCAAFSKPTEIRVGTMVVPQRFDGMPSGMEPLVGKPGEVTDIDEGKGGEMVAVVAGWCWPMSALRHASERTPLPDGWTWSEGFGCRAEVPRDAHGVMRWAGVESEDTSVKGCVYWGPKRDEFPPPDVLAALRTEAKRLGLPWVEPVPTEAPAGYEFEIVRVGCTYVVCRMRDRATFPSGYQVCCYHGADHPERDNNADPERWAGHEHARQWAARLLGEVAPPLRKEGASS